ncbi:hypothetical protein M404DRAFT_26807 [Pisolithus tinctorius Marx 270]|uniref:Uncharacterized protein n=1 Tax=Pisolithus tinctorius Marx 270 TaxID=870435 RepID=A0A0C3P8P0_PISTI|nr:hypothetical protein M404DRAFT_26807 [Pisolithus tinctorius Marx 270]
MLSSEEEEDQKLETSFRSVLKEEQEADMSMTQGHGESAPEMPPHQYMEVEVEQRLEETWACMAEEFHWSIIVNNLFPKGMATDMALHEWYARNFGKAVPPEPPAGGGSKGKVWDEEDEDYPC